MSEAGVARSLTLPPDAQSPSLARQLIREVLRDCGHPEWVDSAELAVTELVTNAVLHAHSEVEVRVECGPHALRVEVHDASQVVPVQRSYGTDASTGRGMALVSAITQDHGIRLPDEGGKVVWFSLTDDPAEPDLDALLDSWDDPELAAIAPEGDRLVTLLGFPATLWLAAQQMHDALLRELVLYRAARDLAIDDIAQADRARSAVRLALESALAHGLEDQLALPEGHPAQFQQLPPAFDLEIAVGPEASADFALLQDTLDEANRLSRQGQLLTKPALPEIIALRDWVADQVISATAGQEPMAWPGADAEHFAQVLDQAVREVDYDVQGVLQGQRTAIVVDSQNRILGISDSLAAEIGWRADDLVGRRVVAIVPPRFREAHVAGLTRHLSTGEAHALEVDLQLPVLRADGSEVLCDFWITADRTASGLAVYVAYVSPAA